MASDTMTADKAKETDLPSGSHLHPNVSLSLTSDSPAQRVTTVLLDGQNFAAWSHSLRLFFGAKGKMSWLLGKSPKPASTDSTFDQWTMDNCTLLGWIFNSMESRIYHMFMYHDSIHGLSNALTKMYAHKRNESRIYQLHCEVSHASQDSLQLSVSDYFGYLQSCWEELAQHEPLSDIAEEATTIIIQRLDCLHTY